MAAGGHEVVRSLKNGWGNVESRKFKVITKIYFKANFERFTNFLNHENLELYGNSANLESSC